MVPKGFGNKKTLNQCQLVLKQPKNAEKCHFFGSFKPGFSILTQLFDFKKKVYREDLFNFGGRNMKDNIKKFTGLTSTHPEMGRSYTFFSSFLSKNLKNTNFGKKIIVKVGFLTQVQ